MFENKYKKIDDLLRRDPGCVGAMDYVEQTSWLLFLKYFNDKENQNIELYALDGKKYKKIFDEKYRWDTWAAPKKDNGKIDIDRALRSDDLINFVNQELFPYLAKFKSLQDIKSMEYKVGEIFSEIKNKISSGNTLRDVIEAVDELSFNTNESKHDISALYENGLAQMGNAGRNGGEYYTPRPLIRTIVKAIDPKIGEKVYDGALGSAGFLVEAFEYMHKDNLPPKQIKKLQEDTLFGQEKKGLSFINAIMNMILHGIDNPNVKRSNSLEENVMDYRSEDKVDVIMTNPPFGGSERPEVKINFEIQNSSETAYLFLQHFVKKLKIKGRAAIIIKNSFLSIKDASKLREWLLNECKIEAILNLPYKVFVNTGAMTVVLFLHKEKSKSDDNIWYYEPQIDRQLGKTSPLVEEDLDDFVRFYKDKKKTKNSWCVKVKDLDTETYDLSVINPHSIKEEVLRKPENIIKDLQDNYRIIEKTLNQIKDIS